MIPINPSIIQHPTNDATFFLQYLIINNEKGMVTTSKARVADLEPVYMQKPYMEAANILIAPLRIGYLFSFLSKNHLLKKAEYDIR